MKCKHTEKRRNSFYIFYFIFQFEPKKKEEENFWMIAGHELFYLCVEALLLDITRYLSQNK